MKVMGLRDTAFWVSWIVFQNILAIIEACLLVGFSYAFRFEMVGRFIQYTKKADVNSITFSIAVREKRFHPKLSPRIASVHRNDIAWILCVLFPEENSFSSSSRLPSVRDRMGISDRDWIRLSVLP